jgi:hypothetical protein
MLDDPKDAPYEYPLSLRCDRETVLVGDDLALRLLDAPLRERLLGISDVEWDADGRLKHYSSSRFDALLSPDLDRTVEFYGSNFVLSTRSTSRAADFNFAIKLLAHTRTSLYIGYRRDGSVAFQAPPCYFGTESLHLTDSSVAELQTLLTAVSTRQNDPKLSIMRDIWMYAMSDAPRRTTRYVEVSTLLEMLLLPKQSTELGFRFALRLAKLAHKFGFGSPEATFQQGKVLYSLRSNLVHGGSDARLEAHQGFAFDFARKLLALYLQNPAVFDNDALDLLCIAA